jgi:hypothetical protein
MLEMRTFLLRVLESFEVDWAFEAVRPKMANYWMMEFFDFFIRFADVAPE